MATVERAQRLAVQEAALDALLGELAVRYEPVPDERVARLAERAPGYERYHRIGHKRQLAYRTLSGDRAAAAAHFAAALRALVSDDDLSSPSWLAQALVAAVGRRQLLEALAGTVEHGSPYEKACAAGAWRWAEPPLRYASEEARRAGRPTASSRAERESLAGLDARFRAALAAALADSPGTGTDTWARERLAELR